MYSLRDIILLAAIVTSIPFCFMRPTYGIVLWTIMSFVNPQDFGWGLVQQSSPALLVAVPTLLGCLFFTKRWQSLNSREIFLMVILFLWFTLTTVNSVYDPAFANKATDAWYKWNQISKIFVMTAATIAIMNDWQRLRWLLLGIAGSFGFLVLKNLPIMILSKGELRVYGPAYSMIADNNDFGLALNMALPFFFFLGKTESNRHVRRLMMFLFSVTIPAIFFTYSRGALVGLVAVLGCMLLQAKAKAVLLPLVVVIVLFAVLLTPEAWRNRMDPDQTLDASARSRLNVWQYSWNLALDYPLLGGGFDAFTPELFARYAPNVRDIHGPHSIYFGVLAEHGFTGLALYLALIVNCVLALGRIIKEARYRRDRVSSGYANMLRISLVGFLSSGAFLGRAYFDFLFFIVACLAILKYLFWADSEEDASVTASDEAVSLDGESEEFHAQLPSRFSLSGMEGI